MDNMKQDESLIIGRHIKWEEIQGIFCKVLQFVPLTIVESGKVQELSDNSPYASLIIECPNLFKEAYMFVFNKEDFLNLWEVFKERGVEDQEEVLVVYDPFKGSIISKLFSRTVPSLLIQIYPTGSLIAIRDFYSIKNELVGKVWSSPIPKAIAEWDARHKNPHQS
ncbi:MAG: hypothetical protein PHE15_06785 [Dehalococcoidales bacterium]|nr:hypothetical protein [Dehalococcoidales bacterium]